MATGLLWLGLSNMGFLPPMMGNRGFEAWDFGAAYGQTHLVIFVV